MTVRFRVVALFVLAFGLSVSAEAQQTASALLLSDIHFDPYRDVTKFSELQKAPAEQWAAILARPNKMPASDVPDEPCPSRGFDTDFPLFANSLAAEQKALPKPAFITVSGDLMAHEFDCRYGKLVAKPTAAEYSAFAAKTVAFVALQVRQAFPGVPVYFTLGNNDSGCQDYREDLDSAYLHVSAEAFAAALPAAARSEILKDFPAVGGDNVLLPPAIAKTRLLMLQDIFLSAGYKGCGAPDPTTKVAPRELQMDWLRVQLAAARAAHEHVWVMAHIPPAVNVYTVISKKQDICGGDKPSEFLKDGAFPQLLLEYADVITLTLFGHTHNDEMHLYSSADGKQLVASKVVPSISPINGNAPSFTIAQVNAQTGVLQDYSVVSASNLSGANATWAETYRYSKLYGKPDFSAASLKSLTTAMVTDRTGANPAATAYEQHWFPGDKGLHAMAARLLWPIYSCSIVADGTAEYKACVCPATSAVDKKP